MRAQKLLLLILGIFLIYTGAFGQEGGCNPPYNPTVVLAGAVPCAGSPFTISAIANGSTG